MTQLTMAADGIDDILDRDNDIIGSRSSKIARMGATINIVSTAIGGGGIFGNIFAASQLGVIGFVFITFCSMTFTFLTIQFLCISSQISKRYSCYALSEEFLGGKKGDLLTKAFITFGNWTFVINIIQIFADFMEHILPIWTQSTSVDSNFFVSREFAVILGLFFIFPFITVQNIKNLEQLSGIFLFFALAILFVFVMNAFSAIMTHQVSSSIELIPTDYNSFLKGLPAITWCWAVQFNVLPVYMTLNPSTRAKQMQSVSYWTVCLLFIYYIIFGISTMIIWGNRINDDFITNLDYNNENYIFFYGVELSSVTQFIMCIITFSSIPIFAFEARRNFHYIITDIYYCCLDKCCPSQIDDDDDENTPLINGNDNINNYMMRRNYEETSMSRFIEGSFLIVSAAIVALIINDLDWTLSVVGATYGCYIAYFIPTVVYYRAIRNNDNLSMKQKCLKYMAFIIFIYGIIVCVFGLTEAFL